MKAGIIGLSNSGKTTIFNLLTGQNVETTIYSDPSLHKNSIGQAKVKDERIDYLSNIYKPKKTIYSTVEFWDTPPLFHEEGKTGLTDVKNSDLLLMVVRAFLRDDVISPDGIDPERDIQKIEEELLLTDLIFVEKRLEKLADQIRKGKKELQKEADIFKKIHSYLEKNIPLREVELTEDERKILVGYQFTTQKPVIVLINISEEQLEDENLRSNLEEKFKNKQNFSLLFVPALIEEEIKELSAEETKEFMDSYGITESALQKVIRKTYDLLGLISFFTVGPDEVRSWSIKIGTNAQKAAGVIHSDLERGFIRAEVVSFSDFQKYGNMTKVKELGLQRLEGKNYIVQDGDIITVRFNV
jgi:GTP-binding protein YchF